MKPHIYQVDYRPLSKFTVRQRVCQMNAVNIKNNKNAGAVDSGDKLPVKIETRILYRRRAVSIVVI